MFTKEILMFAAGLAFGRLIASVLELLNARDAAAFERLFSYLPSRKLKIDEKRRQVTVAWVGVVFYGAAFGILVHAVVSR